MDPEFSGGISMKDRNEINESKVWLERLWLRLSGKENPGFRCENGSQPWGVPAGLRLARKVGLAVPRAEGETEAASGLRAGQRGWGPEPSRSQPAPPRPTWPRAPQWLSQAVTHPSRHAQGTQAPPRAPVLCIFTGSAFPGAVAPMPYQTLGHPLGGRGCAGRSWKIQAIHHIAREHTWLRQ